MMWHHKGSDRSGGHHFSWGAQKLIKATTACKGMRLKEQQESSNKSRASREDWHPDKCLGDAQLREEIKPANAFRHSMLGINRLRLSHLFRCRASPAPVHGRPTGATTAEEQHQLPLVEVSEAP